MTGVPDYMTDQNAVLSDKEVAWLHGKVPNYDSANARWERERTHTHDAGSLEDLVSFIALVHWFHEML